MALLNNNVTTKYVEIGSNSINWGAENIGLYLGISFGNRVFMDGNKVKGLLEITCELVEQREEQGKETPQPVIFICGASIYITNLLNSPTNTNKKFRGKKEKSQNEAERLTNEMKKKVGELLEELNATEDFLICNWDEVINDEENKEKYESNLEKIEQLRKDDNKLRKDDLSFDQRILKLAASVHFREEIKELGFKNWLSSISKDEKDSLIARTEYTVSEMALFIGGFWVKDKHGTRHSYQLLIYPTEPRNDLCDMIIELCDYMKCSNTFNYIPIRLHDVEYKSMTDGILIAEPYQEDPVSDSMQDKDAEISHLKVLLQSKESEIQELNDKLLVLMHEVQQRDAEVSKLQDLLETKKSEIQELNDKLLELMHEVQENKKEIQRIKLFEYQHLRAWCHFDDEYEISDAWIYHIFPVLHDLAQFKHRVAPSIFQEVLGLLNLPSYHCKFYFEYDGTEICALCHMTTRDWARTSKTRHIYLKDQDFSRVFPYRISYFNAAVKTAAACFRGELNGATDVVSSFLWSV